MLERLPYASHNEACGRQDEWKTKRESCQPMRQARAEVDEDEDRVLFRRRSSELIGVLHLLTSPVIRASAQHPAPSG